MFRLPSLTRPFTDHWSEDPAFEQPPTDLPEDADEAAKTAYKEALDAYILKRKHAEESGDWSALRIAGKDEPVRFTVRTIPPDALGKLQDMIAAKVGENEVAMMAFRVALVDVNIPGVTVGKDVDPKFGPVASLSWLDDAGVFGVRIANELGWRAINRAVTVRPLS